MLEGKFFVVAQGEYYRAGTILEHVGNNVYLVGYDKLIDVDDPSPVTPQELGKHYSRYGSRH